MKNSIKSIRLLYISMIFTLAGTSVLAQTTEFDRLKQNFENDRIFEADFSHEYRDAFTHEEQSTEGKIWIGKERYRIEGDQQSMVVDGELSTVYDHSRNRVIVSEYIEEEDDFAPSRMLQGVNESFTVEEEKIPDNRTRITLVSEDPFTVFKTVTIYLGAEGNPLRIVAIDQVDNELITRFGNGRFTRAEPNLFELDVPGDAEWIDLRHESE